MAAQASDWLRYFLLLLWNCWTEFNETWQEARSQSPLPSFCFSGRSEKQDGCPGLWLAETFDFSETAERNSTKFDRKQDFNVLYQVCVFRTDQKTRWPPWPLLGWDIFDFSSETLNGIQRNLRGSKISTSSTKFVFFRLIWKEDGRPGLWLAETFSTSLLKLLNRIQRNLTGSRISTSFTKFVFLCQSKKMSALASDWLRHF